MLIPLEGIQYCQSWIVDVQLCLDNLGLICTFGFLEKFLIIKFSGLSNSSKQYLLSEMRETSYFN